MEKGPATFGVIKRLRDNDMELHTDRQVLIFYYIVQLLYIDCFSYTVFIHLNTHPFSRPDISPRLSYTCGHLHERVDGHKQKSSSICKHYLSEHNSNVPPCLSEQFHVLTKCSNKFDCLIKEILFIRKLKPSLNVQTDSIHAKVFT